MTSYDEFFYSDKINVLFACCIVLILSMLFLSLSFSHALIRYMHASYYAKLVKYLSCKIFLNKHLSISVVSLRSSQMKK